jgi:ABC-type multidrug transport system fused ATPase/permease subunit
MFRVAHHHRLLLYVALLFAVFEATVWPLFSVTVSQAAITVLNPSNSSSNVAFWSGMITLVAVGNVVTSYFRSFFSSFFGARLSQSLRERLFGFLINQSAEWFDARANIQGWDELGHLL